MVSNIKVKLFFFAVSLHEAVSKFMTTDICQGLWRRYEKKTLVVDFWKNTPETLSSPSNTQLAVFFFHLVPCVISSITTQQGSHLMTREVTADTL